MKRALLIIAHGSRREEANSEILELADAVRKHCANSGVDIVQPAFLEIAEPDMPTGLARCVELGAEEVLVLPYFLNTGMHVTVDMPKFEREAHTNHPDIAIRMLPHIGALLSMMPEFIMESIL